MSEHVHCEDCGTDKGNLYHLDRGWVCSDHLKISDFKDTETDRLNQRIRGLESSLAAAREEIERERHCIETYRKQLNDAFAGRTWKDGGTMENDPIDALISILVQERDDFASQICDECDGSGYYYIDDKPVVCVCVGETDPYNDLKAENEHLREGLRKLEFSQRGVITGCPVCPVCRFETAINSHKPDCWLAELLK